MGSTVLCLYCRLFFVCGRKITDKGINSPQPPTKGKETRPTPTPYPKPFKCRFFARPLSEAVDRPMVVRYGCQTLRPGFGHGLPHWQRLAVDQRRHDQQPSAPKATEHAARHPTGSGTRRAIAHRQVVEHRHWLGHLGLAPDTHHPQRGHRHGQPQPFGPPWVTHLVCPSASRRVWHP